MRPNAMCAGRIGKVLVGGLVTVAAVAGSGCGVRPSDPETAFWDQYIRVMDAARLRGDFYAAEAARQNAYLAALGSRRWDAMAPAMPVPWSCGLNSIPIGSSRSAIAPTRSGWR